MKDNKEMILSLCCSKHNTFQGKRRNDGKIVAMQNTHLTFDSIEESILMVT